MKIEKVYVKHYKFQHTHKKDLRAAFIYHFCSESAAPRDNLYSQLVFLRVSNNQEKNRME